MKSKSLALLTLLAAEFFHLNKSVVRKHINNGLRLDLAYQVLKRKDVTETEKKVYVYGLTIEPDKKDLIWERYQNDRRRVVK